MKIVIDKNLILRGYEDKDKDLLYKNSKDPIFLKYLEYKKFSKIKFNTWLNEKINSKNTIFFVIEYKKKAIGTYVLFFTGIRRQICNLGYGISSEYFGKKIFQRVTKKILYKFYKIKKFSAITRSDNLQSIMGLKKLKFEIEGTLKSHYYDLKTNKFHDAIILSYLRKKKTI